MNEISFAIFIYPIPPTSLTCDTKFSFISGKISSSVSYTIDGSTLKSNESFLVSNLAFYNYVLTSSQIRNHMIWAFNDDKPIKSYLAGQNNIFTLQDSQDLYAYRKIFIGKDLSCIF